MTVIYDLIGTTEIRFVSGQQSDFVSDRCPSHRWAEKFVLQGFVSFKGKISEIDS